MDSCSGNAFCCQTVIIQPLLMYAYAMECPNCKNYFTLKEFCLETNPFKVKCTDCGFRLKYTNMNEIVKSIIIASVLILAAGYGISLLIQPPLDTIFMIWVFVGCCVNGFHLVYKKAQFEALLELEKEDEKGE